MDWRRSQELKGGGIKKSPEVIYELIDALGVMLSRMLG